MIVAGLVDFLAELSADQMVRHFWKGRVQIFGRLCLVDLGLEPAQIAVTKVLELDPGECGQVVILSNAYASVGRFHDAEALRTEIKLTEERAAFLATAVEKANPKCLNSEEDMVHSARGTVVAYSQRHQ